MRRTLVLAGTSVLVASTLAFSSQAAQPAAPVFPVGTQLTAAFPYGLTQAEPSIKVDDTGKLYVMAPGSTPIGCELWTLPAGGRSATFHTPPDLGVGGGDCDLALTPPSAGSSVQGLAYSSLSLPNITVGASSDGAQTFSTPNPLGSDIPMTDRQWLASDGNTVYMSYHLVLSNTIAVAASTDGGRTYTYRGNAVDVDHVAQALYNNELGPIVVDTHSSANPKPLYTVMAAPSTANANLASAAGTTSAVANGIYLAMSLDGGRTWKDTDVYVGDPNVSLDRIFPALAVDAGGGLWIAWSDLNHVYVTHSLTRPKTGGRLTDGSTFPTDTSLLGTVTTTLDPVLDAALPEAPGATVTWAAPARVDTGPAQANIYPWLAGGGSHRADMVWYGGTGTSIADPTNQWNAKLAQLTVASNGSLGMVQSTVSDHVIHTGEICTTGVTCPGTSRTLLDFFQVAMSPDGRAAVAWADDSVSAGVAQVYVTEQCAGPSVFTRTLASTC
ncbi:MAG: hypothetical protein QOG99_1456 [Frankiales bacterium]|jgi:hypothetical protein|nr:hypothetical protein [Frankiales bacterium]